MSRKVDYFVARNEEIATRLHKILRVSWNLHSDHLFSNPPKSGMVICDKDYNIRVLFQAQLSNVFNFYNYNFNEGDMVVYCNNAKPTGESQEVFVCRYQDAFHNLSPKIRRFICGTFHTSDIDVVPTLFANVVKQAIVLSLMLSSSNSLTSSGLRQGFLK